MKLTDNQESLLRHIAGGGEPADYMIGGDFRVSAALAFHARERIIKSLIKRGLITCDGQVEITEAGLAELASRSVSR